MIMENFKVSKGHYDVSNCGRFYNNKFNRFIKPRKNSDGYLNVTFCIDGVITNYKAHRLIAEAFIPNPLNLPVINHKDGDKTNNNVENLEWCTSSENRIHAVNVLGCKTGIGIRNVNAKLNDDNIREIRKELSNGATGISLANKYGVDPKQISRIKNNKTWKHIT
jgi:hypothetical protein